MRLAFFGTPETAAAYLEPLRAAGHEISAVVTQPDRPAGRGRHLQPSAVRVTAEALGLPVLMPESASDPQFLAALRALAPDVGVVVAYGQILRCDLLALPPHGFLNVHYSLLPAFRGATPVYAALRAGLTETGVTVQYMARRLDAGDILLQRRVPITPNDNCGTLTDRLTAVGIEALIAALDLLQRGEAPRLPQDEAQAGYVGRVESEDCRIDWNAPAEDIRNLVRACTPAPGAWCLVRDRRVKVQDVRVRQKTLSGEGKPGTIVEMLRGEGPVVATGSGAVELVRLQPQGKRAMSGAEFLRGARLAIGDRFE
jgi:methionyl-tRNA formyltransferase